MVQRNSPSDTIAEVALKAGIIKTTAWRQYNNALGFSAENVILIARAYHKSPVEALVEFGYIRADEMANGETVARLHDASNDELLRNSRAVSRKTRTPTGLTARSSTATNSTWPRTTTRTRDSKPKHRKTDSGNEYGGGIHLWCRRLII